MDCGNEKECSMRPRHGVHGRAFSRILLLIFFIASLSARAEPSWMPSLMALTGDLPLRYKDAVRVVDAYVNANDDERRRIEDAVVARLDDIAGLDGRTNPLKHSVLGSLNIDPRFPKAAVIGLAWRVFIEPGHDHGVEDFLSFVESKIDLRGPELAAALLRLGRIAEPGDTPMTDIRRHIAPLLRHCGPEGYDALLDIGWYPEFVLEEDLYGDDDPARHALLMAKYEKMAAQYGSISTDTLKALMYGYESNPAVREFVRQEVLANLAVETDPYAPSRLRELIGVIDWSRDPFFKDALTGLANELNDESRLAAWKANYPDDELAPGQIDGVKKAAADALKAMEPPAPRPVEEEETPAPVEALPPLEAARRLIHAPDTGVKHWDDEKLVAHRGYRDAVMEISARLEAYDEADSARLQAMLDAAGPVEFKTGDAGALAEAAP